MRHVMKSHTVEAFEIPKGAKVTVKLPHLQLQEAEGGDFLLLGQGAPAPAIGLMRRDDFQARYEISGAPTETEEPRKVRRGRAGKRQAKTPARKVAAKTPARRAVPASDLKATRSRYPAEQIASPAPDWTGSVHHRPRNSTGWRCSLPRRTE